MADKNKPVLEELYPNSSKLYIIFGGIVGAMVIPPFEFYKSSRILDENKLFLRDFSQSWYQCGLPGIAKNAYGIGEFLEEKISEIAPKEVIFVGNSMGGYAAVLFASMLGKGKAIVFAPPIFISPFKRLMHFDKRRIRPVTKMYMKTFLNRPAPVYDLRKWLKTHNGGFTVDIHVSKKEQLDLKYANKLDKFSNIKVYKYNIGGHNLVKHLRDKGKLYHILKSDFTERGQRSLHMSKSRLDL